MKYLILVLFILLPSLAWGNACVTTGTGTGNWTDAAQWTSCGGTYPQPADTFNIIGTKTIEITTAVSVAGGTIGDSAAASTAKLLIASGSTLTTTGAIGVANRTGATNTLEIAGGGKLDLTSNILTLGLSGHTGTVNFVISGTSWSAGGYGEVVGTTGSQLYAAQVAGTVNLTWDYARFDGLLTAPGGTGNRLMTATANGAHNFHVYNCRFLNCGTWQFGGVAFGATSKLDFYQVDFRNITYRTASITGYVIQFTTSSAAPTGGGVRSFKKITTHTPGGGLAFNVIGATIENCVLVSPTVGSGASGGSNAVKYNQLLAPSTFGDTGNWWIVAGAGGDTLDNNILAANNVNHHGITASLSTPLTNPNIAITNNLMQTISGGANQIFGYPNMLQTITNNLVLSSGANFNETHHSYNNNQTIRNNTFIIGDTGTSQGIIWKIEGYLPPRGSIVFRNNLFCTLASLGNDSKLAGMAFEYWETGADPLGPGGYFDYSVLYAANGATITNFQSGLQFASGYTSIIGATFGKGADVNTLTITQAGTDYSAYFTNGLWVRVTATVGGFSDVSFTRKVLSASYASDVTTVVFYPANEFAGGVVNAQRAIPASGITGVAYATGMKTEGVSTGFGAHNSTHNPQFKGFSLYNTTEMRTLKDYTDEALGTTGSTLDTYIWETLKLNGLDKDGNPATYNTAFDSLTVLNYFHDYYQTQNPALETAGVMDDGVTPTYVGASSPQIAPGPRSIFQRIFKSPIFH